MDALATEPSGLRLLLVTTDREEILHSSFDVPAVQQIPLDRIDDVKIADTVRRVASASTLTDGQIGASWKKPTGRGLGAGLRLAHYLGLFAEGHLAAGNADAALAVAEDALEVVAQTGEHLREPYIRRIKVDLVVLAGMPFADCPRACHWAIAEAERLDARIYVWRAHARLGKLMVENGRIEDGSTLIDAAIAKFDAVGMPWDVADARALSPTT